MGKSNVIKKNEILSQENMMSILDTCYTKALDGIPKVSKPVDALAEEYLQKNKNVQKAAQALINAQQVKSATSGFITSLGGLITLPVAVPANITSVLYIQMRMVAAIAYMGGYDLQSDKVQTFVYACLLGNSLNDVLKGTGVKFGQKLATNSIQKISGETIVKINQKIGMRFITKFGETGVINLGKAVPLVGGLIGGGADLFATTTIGFAATKLFLGNRQEPQMRFLFSF